MTISTLAELIAPATVPELMGVLRERTLSFRRAGGENRFAGLIDWPTVRAIVDSGAVHPDLLRVTRGRKNLRKFMYANNGRVDAQRLGGLIAQGISIVVNQLERHAPAIAALCADMRQQLQNERVNLIAVMTNGPGGALDLHYDLGDLLVLQIEGSKRWRVYGSPVCYPLKDTPTPTPPESPPIFDEVLQPGDFLVMPSGYWHHCDNGPEMSLHISCLIRPREAVQVLRRMVDGLAGEDLFRLPLLRMDPQQRAQHEAALKSHLIELIVQMSFSDAAARIEDSSSID